MTILSNGLDSRYITGPELQDYFVNKSTGQPLAFGQIFFYQDTSRTTPKSVYQLTYNTFTGIYSYTALPNPLTLNATGGFDDGNGNNIPVYYFPYDAFGNLQLYYVVAYDSNNLMQFTRDAWPFPSSSSGGGSTSSTTLSLNNMLTNPQFANVNFIAGSTLSIAYTSAGASYTIAPGWVLTIAASNSGTLTVAQTPVAGSSAYPYNPPFLLTITPGSFITSLTLTQQLNSNPDWAAPQTNGVGGYISGSILLAPNSTIIMNYLKNAGSPASQTILSQTNSGGAYAQFNATIELAAASNTNTGLTGNDSIQLVMSSTLPTVFSNVQVIPLTSNSVITTFDQTPINRQVDQMFNYYQQPLNFKPIPSYLSGWDFGLNPTQPLGPTISAMATGANTSNYFYDQTIVFQTANSGVSASCGKGGAVFTAAATTQLALIQYLAVPSLVSMLENNLSVNIYGYTSQVAGLPITISLWATTNLSLPSTIGSSASLVTGLDASGYPTVVAGWTELTRNLIAGQAASFTMADTSVPVDYGFSGWGKNFTAAVNSTYFAIVVGTGSLTHLNTLNLFSISLVPGDIPTRPAPQKPDEVLRESQYYYEMSFNLGTVPAQNAGKGTGEFIIAQSADGGTNQTSGTIGYKVTKIITPTTITTYNPANTNAQVRNESVNADCTSTTVINNNNDGFALTFANTVGGGGSSVGNYNGIHWSSDARLGQ